MVEGSFRERMKAEVERQRQADPETRRKNSRRGILLISGIICSFVVELILLCVFMPIHFSGTSAPSGDPARLIGTSVISSENATPSAPPQVASAVTDTFPIVIPPPAGLDARVAPRESTAALVRSLSLDSTCLEYSEASTDDRAAFVGDIIAGTSMSTGKNFRGHSADIQACVDTTFAPPCPEGVKSVRDVMAMCLIMVGQ
jgi:hypothetical protein